jgi:hypothetical protein
MPSDSQRRVRHRDQQRLVLPGCGMRWGLYAVHPVQASRIEWGVCRSVDAVHPRAVVKIM